MHSVYVYMLLVCFLFWLLCLYNFCLLREALHYNGQCTALFESCTNRNKATGLQATVCTSNYLLSGYKISLDATNFRSYIENRGIVWYRNVFVEVHKSCHIHHCHFCASPTRIHDCCDKYKIFCNAGLWVTLFSLVETEDLQKFIKHTPVDTSGLPPNDTDIFIKEATVAKNNSRKTECTKYTNFQREMYIHYVFKNDAAAKLANVNTHTARKWKAKYIANPDADVLPKKKRIRLGSNWSHT